MSRAERAMEYHGHPVDEPGVCICRACKSLTALLASVAAEERERAAKVAEGFQLNVPFSMQCNCHATTARDIAAAIREGK